jgi:energy-converting hydrogenase Eha subunit C
LESRFVVMALVMIALIVAIVSTGYSNIAEESVLANDYEI